MSGGGYRRYPLNYADAIIRGKEGIGYIPWGYRGVKHVEAISRGVGGDIGDIPSIMRGNECRGYIPWDRGV